mgnify:CR=1 FL=1
MTETTNSREDPLTAVRPADFAPGAGSTRAGAEGRASGRIPQAGTEGSQVRSGASPGAPLGTPAASLGDLFPDLRGPEAPVISGIASDSSEAMVTLRGILDQPGLAARVFSQFAEAGINIDMGVQAQGRSESDSQTADISITFPEVQTRQVRQLLDTRKEKLGYTHADINPSIGKVSLIGVGMKTHTGVMARCFEALSHQNINVLMISTSDIRISAIIPLDALDSAVRAIHTAFNLDSLTPEAVVYAGSGR